MIMRLVQAGFLIAYGAKEIVCACVGRLCLAGSKEVANNVEQLAQVSEEKYGISPG
jgi:hypothetical protein